MATVTCPGCQRKLKAPDSDKLVTLRCPSCRRVFDLPAAHGGNGDSIPVAAKVEEEAQTDGSALINILSAADEAMLRDFGSGSGLLELTREQIGTAGDVHVADGGPAFGTGTLISEDVPAVQGERQFQIVATALTLANKLVLTYKGDLIRTRKNGRLAWICVAAMAMLVAGIFGWGMLQYGSNSGEQSKTTAAQGRVDDAQKQIATLAAAGEERKAELARLKTANDKLQSQLDTARDEARSAAGQASGTQEKLTLSEASVGVLTANLETLKLKNEQLVDQVARLKAAQSQPTTQPK